LGDEYESSEIYQERIRNKGTIVVNTIQTWPDLFTITVTKPPRHRLKIGFTRKRKKEKERIATPSWRSRDKETREELNFGAIRRSSLQRAPAVIWRSKSVRKEISRRLARSSGSERKDGRARSVRARWVYHKVGEGRRYSVREEEPGWLQRCGYI